MAHTDSHAELLAEFQREFPDAPLDQAERVTAMRLEMRRYAHTLAQLRKAREKTQAQLAAEMGMLQGDISKLEKRTDAYLSTLERYVSSLGGELRLIAVFDGEEYELKLADLAGETEAAPARSGEAVAA
ncbi:MAG: transcriptional regulator [Armatimonadetes bacterium]|jgi:hypothetical protein|nr:transcriptional regulator [Armatimonadota bacterium]